MSTTPSDPNSPEPGQPKPRYSVSRKGMGGRARVITLELVREVSAEIARGVPKRVALEGVKLNEETWNMALSRNAEYQAVFADARLRFVSTALDRIRAGDKGWQGAAWILERRYTEHFGVKIAPQVQVNVGIGIGEDQVAKIQAFAREKLGTRRADRDRLKASEQQPVVVDVAPASSPLTDQPSPCSLGQPPCAGQPEAAPPSIDSKATEPERGDEW